MVDPAVEGERALEEGGEGVHLTQVAFDDFT